MRVFTYTKLYVTDKENEELKNALDMMIAAEGEMTGEDCGCYELVKNIAIDLAELLDEYVEVY